MINATELRIGNIVNDGTGISTVKKISSDDETFFEPIPLTEDWLIKFGFKQEKICIMSDIARRWHEEQRKGSSMDNCYKMDNYHIVPRIGMVLNTGHLNNNLTMDSARVGERLSYVHQLQNLFFALTGKELSI